MLPRAVLRDTISLLVSTYVATIDSLSNEAPVMGDTFQYYTSVEKTRDGSQVLFTATYESTDLLTVRFLPGNPGRALARDTGTATISVTVSDPSLPNGIISDSELPLSISEERFYGLASATSGDFGDAVYMVASEVHEFTDSSRVLFPNGTIGYVDSISVAQDTLWFTVGAGTDTGQLTLRHLKATDGTDRDSVLTYYTFTGGGTVDDPFEPNDGFPLPDPDSVELTSRLPFEAYLSMDPAKTPSDSNFFWVRVPSGLGENFDIKAEWQQDGNIDFFICNGTGIPTTNPPAGYDDMACTRLKADNASGAGDTVEEVSNIALGPGRHVLAFYCPAAGPCPTEALTYKLTVIRR
jgi:hypothetical protein